MKQEKKRIIQGTTSNFKPGTYEAMLRREKARSEKIESVAAKLETFASELKADGVRYFIFIKSYGKATDGKSKNRTLYYHDLSQKYMVAFRACRKEVQTHKRRG